MTTAVMIRIDDLKLPLHILRAMMLDGSEEVVRELKTQHKAYLEENCPKLAALVAYE